MKYFLSRFVDVEIYDSLPYEIRGKHVDVLLFRRRIAKFFIEAGSTKIERL